MQFINKGNTPPPDWEKWFTTSSGKRTYDYRKDISDLHFIRDAKQYLINEQNGYCAYCNQEITLDTASIEHVIPKEHNISLSTAYFNLIAVCKTPLKDPDTGLDHCDKVKGSKLITPFVFATNCDVSLNANHAFFIAKSDGMIMAKPTLSTSDYFLAEAFINTLNLNHSLLKQRRADDMLAGLLQAYMHCDAKQKAIYWKTQFHRILLNKKIPFRAFLLIYIASRIGIN